MSDFRFLICWLLALGIGALAIRDLKAGTSGVSGMIPLTFTRSADPVGYIALIGLKLGAAVCLTVMALRFAGMIRA